MRLCIAIGVLALACSPALADDAADTAKDMKDTKAATKEASATMPAEGGADMAAMMKKWEEAGTPGKYHSYLKPMEGTFDTKVTSWMEMGKEPSVSTGKSVNKFLFDGRYLEQRFDGDFMGMPFQGVGYVGYDNLKKHYFSTWIDSMSTMMMTTTGNADASGKVLSFEGDCTDPMSGKPTHMKTVITIKGPNEYLMEMWGPDMKTGKTYKNMEMTYTRVGNM